jgi:hypothetical protein
MGFSAPGEYYPFRMICIESGLYVRIAQLEGARAPVPLPLSSGFNSDTAYRVLGAFSPSETSEAYLVLSNDEDELWFISNRHCRSWKVLPTNSETRLPMQ